MQETSGKTEIQSPTHYDWSGFTLKPRGFIAEWCRNHQHANGEPFNGKTVYMLIAGTYVAGSGPKISEIIRAALAEGLIVPLDELDEAA